MDKSLIALNETNILKIFAMFNMKPEQRKAIDSEEKDEIQWIQDNWDELSVLVHGEQISDGLIEFTKENILKIIGGFQIALQKEIEFDDIPAYVVNVFSNLSVKDKGYYKNGNEIFFKKTDGSILE